MQAAGKGSWPQLLQLKQGQRGNEHLGTEIKAAAQLSPPTCASTPTIAACLPDMGGQEQPFLMADSAISQGHSPKVRWPSFPPQNSWTPSVSSLPVLSPGATNKEKVGTSSSRPGLLEPQELRPQQAVSACGDLPEAEGGRTELGHAGLELSQARRCTPAATSLKGV